AERLHPERPGEQQHRREVDELRACGRADEQCRPRHAASPVADAPASRGTRAVTRLPPMRAGSDTTRLDARTRRTMQAIHTNPRTKITAVLRTWVTRDSSNRHTSTTTHSSMRGL